MSEREHVVTALLAAANGELVGRVRLQKTAYLLDQLGLNSGFEYEYHHYGPYSRDLDHAVADAKAFGMADEDRRNRRIDGAQYSVFLLTEEGRGTLRDASFGDLGRDRAAALVEKLAGINVTVLELAATVHWLRHQEHCADWRAEIVKRKGWKTENGRLEKAVALLEELGLGEANTPAA